MSGPADRQYCTFAVGGRWLALAVTEVQEVLAPRSITPVPLAPPAVRGVINLRGEIVTVLDLARRFGPAEDADGAGAMHVVARGPDGPVSLLVDTIGDVIELDPATREPLPATATGPGHELLSGLHQCADQVFLVLDGARATHLTPISVPAPAAGT